jgi:hypothetical protein
MIHLCQDESPPIGRPPIVRDALLAKLRSMQRATVARLAEETGLCVGSTRAAMKVAFARGEVTREKRVSGNLRYYVYEIELKDA